MKNRLPPFIGHHRAGRRTDCDESSEANASTPGNWMEQYVMRAIRFNAFGDPAVLEMTQVERPAVDEGTALVRVMAASVNPSDVKNVAGAMRQTSLPRIPGRDFAGVVEAGPAEWIGVAVWGTGGDVGFIRDGSHAEMIAVPIGSLRRMPTNLSFDQAASVGVNFVAAWCGLAAAGVTSEDTVVLIGAGGGVGGAAGQIARHFGAHVIGVDRRLPPPEAAIHRTAEKLIVYGESLSSKVLAATNGTGADVVFDLVGGVVFQEAVRCLGPRGRLIEIASTGQREVTFDLPDFYHNESTLIGVDTLKRDLTASADVLDRLTPGFATGEYQAAPIAETLPLGAAEDAYRKVLRGSTGRIVLHPQE